MKIIQKEKNYKVIQSLIEEIKKSFYGKEETIRLLLVGLFAQGHILIEDVPGVGKTTLARALAKAINCSFKRIQFTSDLLPSDIIGITVWNKESQSFIFKEGPIFANVVLADEINRGTPKTQSALLEAMNEYQISIDNETYALPKPFIIIATQNPLEFYGVYPLPENELDRFMLNVEIGYPSLEIESKIIVDDSPSINVEKTETILDEAEICKMQKEVMGIYVSREIIDYAMRILRKTRQYNEILLGASPRAGKHLIMACRALAYMEGRNYVLPDDVKKLAKPVLAHKLILKQYLNERNNKLTENIIDEILSNTEIP